MNDAIVVLLVRRAVRRRARTSAGCRCRRRSASWSAAPLIGLAVGWAGAWALRRVALPAAGLYPLAAVGLTVLAYAIGSLAHASGFLAIYVAGIVLGNARLPHRQAILGFADGLGWLAQIGLFVLLGLLASPSRLIHAVVPGPDRRRGAAVRWPGRSRSRLSVTPFRLGWREQAFLSWAGLRGAVPIVLATIPLSERLPGATTLFDVVFVVVVIFTRGAGHDAAAGGPAGSG